VVARFFAIVLLLSLAGGVLSTFEDQDVPVATTTVVLSTMSAEPDGLASTTDAPVTTGSNAVLAVTSVVTAQPSRPASFAADEIDCEQAEELADWGDYEAGDIADYCDYGPDPGELPDDFDWDE